MNKPTIVLIARDTTDSMMSRLENPERLALIYNFQEELGCEVIADYTDTYYLTEPKALARMTELTKQECLVAIIISQSEYSGDTTKVIERVRRSGLAEIPIILQLHYHNREEEIEPGQHEQFVAYSHSAIYDDEFWQDMKRLVENTKLIMADKAKADALSLRQLQQAYDHNYGDDDTLSAIDETLNHYWNLCGCGYFKIRD